MSFEPNFRYVLLSTLSFGVMTGSGFAHATASPSPLPRVGEAREVSLSLPPPSLSRRSSTPLVIRDEGAAFVKVHFSLFDLPEGVVAEVSSSEGTEVYRYGAGEKDDLTQDEVLGEDGLTRFASMSITGDTAIVRLVGTPHEGWGAHQGIRIDRYDQRALYRAVLGHLQFGADRERGRGRLVGHRQSAGENDLTPDHAHPACRDRITPGGNYGAHWATAQSACGD